jgi:hypothetical protein
MVKTYYFSPFIKIIKIVSGWEHTMQGRSNSMGVHLKNLDLDKPGIPEMKLTSPNQTF